MTSKERMLRALAREKPDRLPATIHQWQPYHLDHYMGGVDALAAFKAAALHAVTYQSAEADGALPMKLAADWFCGKEIDKPVYYLPKHVITKDDVDQYLPAQW